MTLLYIHKVITNTQGLSLEDHFDFDTLKI